MFPYADNLGAERSPVVWALIAIMSLVWLGCYVGGLERQAVAWFAFNPQKFSVFPWTMLPTLITASFLHAGVFHLLGNLIFLWTFGRSLEGLFGSLLFAILFPFLGAVGFLTQWMLEPGARFAIIGASGSIATLLGAYLVLFPYAKMKVVVVWLPFWKRFQAPAWAFLGYWIGLQLVSLALGRGQIDGVAYAVHVGGFCFGALAAAVWKTSYPSAEEDLLSFRAHSEQSREAGRD